MPNQVVFMVDAKHEAALRKWQQIQSAIDSTNASIRKTGQELDKANNSAGAAITAAVGKVGQALAGFMQVGSAIGTITTIAFALKSEYQNLLDRQQGFSERSESSARGNARFVTSVWAKGADEEYPTLESFKAGLADQMQTTGIPPNIQQTAAAGPLSSAGGLLPYQKIIDDMRVAGEYLGKDASVEELSSFTRGMVELQKAKRDMTAEAAAGMILQIQMAAQASTVGQVSKNAMPAITQLMRGGWDMNEASAFVSAVSQASGDVEMLQTATGSIKLAEWMRQLKERQGVKNKAVAGMSTKEYVEWVRTSDEQDAIDARLLAGGDAGPGEGDFVGKKKFSRLRRLQRMKQYKGLEQLPGEARTEKAIKDYLTRDASKEGEGVTMEYGLRTAREALPKSNQDAERVYRESLTELQKDQDITLQDIGGLVEGTRQRQARANQEAALAGKSVENIEEWLYRDTGATWLGGKIDAIRSKWSIGGDTEAKVTRSLKAAIEERLRALTFDQKFNARYGTPRPESIQERSIPILQDLVKQLEAKAVQQEVEQRERNLRIQIEDPAGRPMGRAMPRQSGIKGASD